MDLAEAITNAIIGLAISIAITWLWLGFSPLQSVGITAVFFGTSTARTYILRKLFRWLA